MRTISFILFFLLCTVLGPVTRTADAPKPNIILFCSDDHGWRDAGCYGNKDVRTPNMDRLTTEGMRFTHAYAASPLCSPSRCVIETGLMPFRNGAHVFNAAMKPGTRTLPVYFKELGYYTAELGKFHHSPKTPKAFPYDFIQYEADPVDFIKKYNKPQPLLLVYNTRWMPHRPWPKNKTYNPSAFTLQPNFVDTPETRRSMADYYTAVTDTDKLLGDVLKAVDERGIRDNTLFIYTTDQGADWPFAKWCVYDAGLRVPFIVRWPGKVSANVVTDAMVSLADLVPLFIDVAGGKPPVNLDGRSFSAILTGQTNRFHDVVFGTHSAPDYHASYANLCTARTIITPQYQYILNLNAEKVFRTVTTNVTPGMGARSKFYDPFWDSWVNKAKTDKHAAAIVNAYRHRPREELYDLIADPYEMHNVINDQKLAGIRLALRQQLTEWCRQQGDTEPLEYLKP